MSFLFFVLLSFLFWVWSTAVPQKCGFIVGSEPNISPEDQHEYHFITNAMHLSAQTIADIYKERWQIELFFKWVKQNLKIKTFLGTSANAVMTQFWVALCLYLILAFIRFISKTVHSMREILNWIRINLFSNEILDDYLIPKMTEPIVNSQLALF